MKYELGSYVPEDDILHSHRRENLKSYNRLFIGKTVEFPQKPKLHSAEIACFIHDGEIEGDVGTCLLVISIDPSRSHVERASRGWNLG
jgi:hypothetical protein